MADITRIPIEPALPEVAGGRSRPSVRVDLAQYPAIQHRQDLNARLLEQTCAFDRGRAPQFELSDVTFLVQATAERFGGEQVLLRSHAITALGQLRSIEAAERLAHLAASPAEHESVRVTAVRALSAVSPALAEASLSVLMHDVEPALSVTARRLKSASACPPLSVDGDEVRQTATRRRTRRRTPSADKTR